jgi:hypothetical protein
LAVGLPAKHEAVVLFASQSVLALEPLAGVELVVATGEIRSVDLELLLCDPVRESDVHIGCLQAVAAVVGKLGVVGRRVCYAVDL